uniref:RNA polymerase Rpb6 n=1 Tax=Pithovirus LCDPAC01 TaxID=2506600 RepID=A0A481YNP9_9VIRU|nr:MAG: RNA polymerase Rpb6 [Pithovirus LCDPAC01]
MSGGLGDLFGDEDVSLRSSEERFFTSKKILKERKVKLSTPILTRYEIVALMIKRIESLELGNEISPELDRKTLKSGTLYEIALEEIKQRLIKFDIVRRYPVTDEQETWVIDDFDELEFYEFTRPKKEKPKDCEIPSPFAEAKGQRDKSVTILKLLEVGFPCKKSAVNFFYHWDMM